MSLAGFIAHLKVYAMANPLLWVCCAVSFVLAVSFVKLAIIVCKRERWYDIPSERKVHKGLVPRLGGAGFVSAFILSCVLYAIFELESAKMFAPFVCTGLLVFVAGVADDFLDLRAVVKFALQCIAALIMVSSGYVFESCFSLNIPRVIAAVGTFMWIVGIINSYNMIDGIDGLCGGLSALALFTLGLVYTLSGGNSAAMCFILVSAILGFLVFNKPKAKIFMGDGGSQFLGFMVASVPLFKTTANFEGKKMLIALCLAAIPMMDCIAAFVRRTRDHRSVMSPDKLHLHHKLMNLGLSSSGVLLLLLSMQTAICVCVVASMAIKTARAYVLLIAVEAVLIGFFAVVHILNKAKLAKLQEMAGERDNPSGRIGDKALPRDKGGFKATAASVRQADDLLPLERPHARKHPRHPRDFNPARLASLW